MSNSTVNGFPSQKKTIGQKTKEWRKQCVDFAETQSSIYSEGVRQSKKQKFLNYQLYNGYIDMDDLELVINPHQTIASYLPDKIPHYPIAAPKIDLLVGEELNRRFEYKVVVSNPDAISEKEEAKAELWRGKLMDIVKQAGSKEDQQESLKRFDKYLKFDWQDIKELTATNILRHYSEKQHFKHIFNEAFKDKLLSAEEIIQCDIVSNEPIMTKLNPLNVHTIRSSGSKWIQDSDLIIVEDYWSPGKIVDNFYDVLTPKEIELLEENFAGNSVSLDKHQGNIHNEPNLFVNTEVAGVNDFITMAEGNGHNFGSFFDTNGNVRILRVYWRSFRKVQKIKYYDEDGDTQTDYFPENYVADKNKGEESTTQWVNEIWEGTKLGDHIYVQMRPKPVQYSDINNPSLCHAGIIGLVDSTNQFKSVSTMDRMKQYQYLYDVEKDRLNKALAKYLGPLLELDLALIPENWQMDKWLHFAYANGIATKDSFKEGNKGASIGKLAGNIPPQGSRVINLEMGNFIQNKISFLEYIKADMANIIGISPQREGAISNRETVGGVERSVNQSSHITEQLFASHELFKAKVLECFLETAKISFKTGNKKMQYILGDESIAMLEVDDSFADGCYDILISFNDKYQKLEQVMESLAQAGIQNDKMDFSTLMGIYMSSSLSETRRAIELKEQEKLDRESQQFQQEQETRKVEAQSKAQVEQQVEAGEERRNIRDNEYKLLIAQLQSDAKQRGEFDEDGILAESELNREELQLKMQELQQKDKHHAAEIEVKKMDIAAKKAKPASK